MEKLSTADLLGMLALAAVAALVWHFVGSWVHANEGLILYVVILLVTLSAAWSLLWEN